MEETISKEKKKPGPLSYKNEGLKIKIKGNYNQKSLRVDYFDQIKFFAELPPASSKYADGEAVSSLTLERKTAQKTRHKHPKHEKLPRNPQDGKTQKGRPARSF